MEIPLWRGGREAEGGGLLNRYTINSRIEGSNPSLSVLRAFGICSMTSAKHGALFYRASLEGGI